MEECFVFFRLFCRSPSTGEKFWCTQDPGQQPFTYQVGVGAVIDGWDMGTLGMQVGEVRRVDIPSDEGYGEQGFPVRHYCNTMYNPCTRVHFFVVNRL